MIPQDTGMQRVPEPELMCDTGQAEAYALADFSEPNALFMEQFQARFPGIPEQGRALDLGCGPADIPVAFARQYPGWMLDLLDGAEAMLALARRRLEANPDLAARFRLLCDVLPSPGLERQGYDAILSNSLLHHLHDPSVLWDSVRRCARPGAAVLIMDLARPASPAIVDELVATYASDAPALLRRDFRASLHAAFRLEEVQAQLDAAGLHGWSVESVSDRHLIACGRVPTA